MLSLASHSFIILFFLPIVLLSPVGIHCQLNQARESWTKVSDSHNSVFTASNLDLAAVLAAKFLIYFKISFPCKKQHARNNERSGLQGAQFMRCPAEIFQLWLGYKHRFTPCCTVSPQLHQLPPQTMQYWRKSTQLKHWRDDYLFITEDCGLQLAKKMGLKANIPCFGWLINAASQLAFYSFIITSKS